jgi:hypothetical protein
MVQVAMVLLHENVAGGWSQKKNGPIPNELFTTSTDASSVPQAANVIAATNPIIRDFGTIGPSSIRASAVKRDERTHDVSSRKERSD